MKIVVAARKHVGVDVASVVPCKVMRRDADPVVRQRIYKAQPDIVILDKHVSAARGGSLGWVPRILAEVRNPVRVIALMEGVTEKRRTLAAMAGCYDLIDLSELSWRDDLGEAVQIACESLASPPLQVADRLP